MSRDACHKVVNPNHIVLQNTALMSPMRYIADKSSFSQPHSDTTCPTNFKYFSKVFSTGLKYSTTSKQIVDWIQQKTI